MLFNSINKATSKKSDPISFVGYRLNSETSNIGLSSLQEGSNSVPTAGDLVIIISGKAVGSSITVPSGCTQLANLFSGTTRKASLGVFYKISAGETTITGADSACQYLAYVFRNANQTTPIDVSTVTASGTGTGAVDPPSITPSTVGGWVISAGFGSLPDGWTIPNTPPTGESYSKYRSTLTIAGFPDGTLGGTVPSINWQTGSVNPAAWSAGSSGGLDAWCAATLVIRRA